MRVATRVRSVSARGKRKVVGEMAARLERASTWTRERGDGCLPGL